MSCPNRLGTSNADGPDGIPPQLKQECSTESPQVCAWSSTNHSAQVKFLRNWNLQTYNVTSIHWKNAKEAAGNFQSILLPPIVSKVLERLVFDHLLIIWRKQYLISTRVFKELFLCYSASICSTWNREIFTQEHADRYYLLGLCKRCWFCWPQHPSHQAEGIQCHGLRTAWERRSNVLLLTAQPYNESLSQVEVTVPATFTSFYLFHFC